MENTEETVQGPRESGGQTELERIEGLVEENRNLRDQLMRAVADFDNYRRRAAAEREDVIHRANAQLLAELLPIVDDFRRSIEVDEASRDSKSFYDGVAMIYNKILKLLESRGVEAFNAVGQQFDVDRHEALLRQPSDAGEGTVIGEIEPGYTYKDRVLRFAKVIVSSGNPE